MHLLYCRKTNDTAAAGRPTPTRCAACRTSDFASAEEARIANELSSCARCCRLRQFSLRCHICVRPTDSYVDRRCGRHDRVAARWRPPPRWRRPAATARLETSAYTWQIRGCGIARHASAVSDHGNRRGVGRSSGRRVCIHSANVGVFYYDS